MKKFKQKESTHKEKVGGNFDSLGDTFIDKRQYYLQYNTFL